MREETTETITMWLLIILGLAFLCGVAAPLFGVALLRQRSRIVRTRVEPVGSVAEGQVAVVGKAVPLIPYTAPFSGQPAAYCEYRASHLKVAGRGKHTTVNFETLGEGKTRWPFIVEDSTGRALVTTDEAWMDIPENLDFQNCNCRGQVTELTPPHIMTSLADMDVRTTDGAGRVLPMCFSENRIDAGADAYVIGYCSKRPQDIASALGGQPDPDGKPIHAVIMSGPGKRDQHFVSLGNETSVPRRLLKHALMCLTLGPLAALVSGGIILLSWLSG